MELDVVEGHGVEGEPVAVVVENVERVDHVVIVLIRALGLLPVFVCIFQPEYPSFLAFLRQQVRHQHQNRIV